MCPTHNSAPRLLFPFLSSSLGSQYSSPFTPLDWAPNLLLPSPVSPQPDRKPKPAMMEVKAVYSAIKMSFMQGNPRPDGSMHLALLFRNRFFFRSTSFLAFQIRVRLMLSSSDRPSLLNMWSIMSRQAMSFFSFGFFVGACCDLWGEILSFWRLFRLTRG